VRLAAAGSPDARCLCLLGEYRLFWTVHAVDIHAALEQLPAFVAERTDALEIRTVFIP